MWSRRRPARDEKGAVLVLASMGLVIAMIAGALAVDIGGLAQDARQDQKVADLAALDAIRGTPANFLSLAQASAARNGFPTGTGYSVTAVEGTKSGNSCPATSVAGAGTVCVTVTSPYKNNFPFVSGRTSVTRTAMASTTAYGGFMIGSSLATFDTSRSAVLDRFMGGMLRGSGLSISAVSWSGLAGGNITLDALRFQLASMGFSVGTVSDLLAANLTAAQLMQATAQALALQGPTAATSLTALNALRTQIAATTLTSFTLGQFMHVAQGADNAALASQLNVFQLATASAQMANGNNFIDVPSVGISLPVGSGVVSTAVKLQVIQPPQFYFGPVGGSVSTAQIDLTVTPKLDLPISILGLVGAHVKNDLPVHITAAGALGTLSAASCATSPGITVTVDPAAFSGSATASLDVYASVLVLGDIPILRIPTTNVVPSTNGGPSDLTFSYPTQFPPPLGSTTSKHAGSQPIGLQSLTTFTAGTPVVLNAVAAPLLGSIVTTTINALSPLIGQVDNVVLTPLLQALGLDVGSADVTALALQCNTPTLSG
jgi:uncharacterized membrane protein